MVQNLSNFMICKNNVRAFDASVYFSQNLDDDLNPLCLFGPVGVGKTHLLNAIQQSLWVNHPTKKITYIEAGKYFEKLVSLIRQNKDPNYFFSNKLNCDVVLLDEAEVFFKSRLRQDVLTNLLEILLKRRCKVVVAGIINPHDFKSLDQKLKDLFKSGIICQIPEPGLNDRLKLLHYFRNLHAVHLSEKTLRYIANRPNISVRKLHGAILTAKKKMDFELRPA